MLARGANIGLEAAFFEAMPVQPTNGKDFTQQGDLVAVSAERVGDFRRHGLGAEKPQAHAGVASNSANSRA